MRKLSERTKLKSKAPPLIQLLRNKTAGAAMDNPTVIEATIVQHKKGNLWHVHLQFPGEEYRPGPGFESQAVAEDITTPPYSLPLKFKIVPNEEGWMEADPDRIAKEPAQLKAAMAAIAAAPGEDLVRFKFEGKRYRTWRQGRNEPFPGGIAIAPDTFENADCGPDPYETPLLPGETSGPYATLAEAMAAAKKIHRQDSRATCEEIELTMTRPSTCTRSPGRVEAIGVHAR